jgi:hypothetical protein
MTARGRIKQENAPSIPTFAKTVEMAWAQFVVGIIHEGQVLAGGILLSTEPMCTSASPLAEEKWGVSERTQAMPFWSEP